MTITASNGWAHSLSMIDQRRLPLEEVYLEYTDTREVAEAIRTMVVRGAPAIGSAAGFGMALAAIHAQSGSDEGLLRESGESREHPESCPADGSQPGLGCGPDP